MDDLTPMEIRVLMCAAEGMQEKETAEQLHIAFPTVKTHRAHVMMKLGARNMIQAVALGMRKGVIQ